MKADPLHAAFESFLSGRDEAALLAAVQQYGGRAPSKGVDFPVAHRICDVQLGGSGFRVVRVFDPDDHTTKLFIYPTDHPLFAQPGVPFRLQAPPCSVGWKTSRSRPQRAQ
jgi:hypothetical protein